MLSTRRIDTRFWKDDFTADLMPMEKYLYSYLITNPRGTGCGIYWLDINSAASELGIEVELISKMLSYFQSCRKLIYTEETDEILLLDWYRYNKVEFDSGNEKLINDELRVVKNQVLLRELFRILKEENGVHETLLKGMFKDIQAV
ncbi:MAG: hypothetical protein Q8930_10410 [Bacillota bacterium]|nr:hypothetical protein [Bacillota bacterium]